MCITAAVKLILVGETPVAPRLGQEPLQRIAQRRQRARRRRGHHLGVQIQLGVGLGLVRVELAGLGERVLVFARVGRLVRTFLVLVALAWHRWSDTMTSWVSRDWV